MTGRGRGLVRGEKQTQKKKPIVRDVAPQAGNSRISEALIGQIIGDAGNREEPFPNTDSRKQEVRRPLDATQRHLNNEQQHKHTKPTTDSTTNTTLTLNTHTSDRFY